jgi:hypothetical protein
MMNDSRFEQLRTALQTESDRRIDVDRAWVRFQRRRPQARKQRRRLIAAAATAAVVAAVAVSAAVVRLDGGVGSHSGATGPAAVTPASDAVAARIPVADVVSLTAYGSDVWALTGSHELVRIDARTNSVTLRVHVASVANGSPVVAGGGALWLDGTGPAGHARLLKIDPATGAISARTTLPAGCGQAAYGLGHVWVLCNASSTAQVLRIDPATAQVDAQTGVLPGPAFTFVAGSEGVWLGTNAGFSQVDPSGTHLTGLKVTGSPRYFNPESTDYIGAPNATQLALGDGTVWVLFGNVSGRPEDLAEINPVTGRITRAFTYAEVADTSSDYWDLNAAFGQGSIWMLAPLGHNEIVRISTTTGNPVSRVYPGGSCSQYCSQVYATAGAVWEPTTQQIIRINPAVMPG